MAGKPQRRLWLSIILLAALLMSAVLGLSQAYAEDSATDATEMEAAASEVEAKAAENGGAAEGVDVEVGAKAAANGTEAASAESENEPTAIAEKPTFEGSLETITLTGIPVIGFEEGWCPTDPLGYFEDDGYYSLFEEDSQLRENAGNYSIASSNSSIMTAKLIEEDQQPQFVLNAIGAGSCTITATYHFEGEYATYEATQVLDVTVRADSSEVGSVEVSQMSIDVPFISKCDICGDAHGFSKENTIIVTMADTNGDTNLTSDICPEIISSDDSIACATSPEALGSGRYSFVVCSQGIGNATLSVYSSTEAAYSGEEAAATIEVTTHEAEKPTLVGNSETTLDSLFLNDVDFGDVCINGIEGVDGTDWATGALGTYKYGEYLQLLGWLVETTDNETSMSVDDECAFVFGLSHAQYVDPNGNNNLTKQVLFLTVDDTSIVTVEENSSEENVLVPHAEGETDVHVSDIWGNEFTTHVIVKDFGKEAQDSYSLTQNELTIEVGQMVDLRQYIQGTASIDYFVCKSTDRSIAKTISQGDEVGIFTAVGCKPGDTAINLGVLRGGDAGGSDRYLDEMETADFGTMTIHVVDPSTPTVKATADSVTSGAILKSTEEFAGILEDNPNINLVILDSVAKTDAMKDELDYLTATLAEEDGKERAYELLDLHLVDEDGKVVPVASDDGASMVVRVELTGAAKTFDPDTIEVFYIGKDGESDYKTSWVADGYLYFITDHFSDYAIVGVPTGTDSNEPEEPTEPVDPVDPDSPKDPDDPTDPNEPSGPVNPIDPDDPAVDPDDPTTKPSDPNDSNNQNNPGNSNTNGSQGGNAQQPSNESDSGQNNNQSTDQTDSADKSQSNADNDQKAKASPQTGDNVVLPAILVAAGLLAYIGIIIARRKLSSK